MSDNVYDLRGGARHGVNESYVSFLEEELARAKAGETQGCAMAILHNDNTASYVVIGRVGGFGMLGALDVAKQQLIEVVSE